MPSMRPLTFAARSPLNSHAGIMKLYRRMSAPAWKSCATFSFPYGSPENFLRSTGKKEKKKKKKEKKEKKRIFFSIFEKTQAFSHLPHTADAQKLSLRTQRPAWHPVTSPCAELHIDGRGRCCRRTEQMCNHALNVHEKRTGRKEGRVLHSSHVRAHFQTRPVRTRVPCTIDVIAVYLGTVV